MACPKTGVVHDRRVSQLFDDKLVPAVQELAAKVPAPAKKYKRNILELIQKKRRKELDRDLVIQEATLIRVAELICRADRVLVTIGSGISEREINYAETVDFQKRHQGLAQFEFKRLWDVLLRAEPDLRRQQLLWGFLIRHITWLEEVWSDANDDLAFLLKKVPEETLLAKIKKHDEIPRFYPRAYIAHQWGTEYCTQLRDNSMWNGYYDFLLQRYIPKKLALEPSRLMPNETSLYILQNCGISLAKENQKDFPDGDGDGEYGSGQSSNAKVRAKSEKKGESLNSKGIPIGSITYRPPHLRLPEYRSLSFSPRRNGSTSMNTRSIGNSSRHIRLSPLSPVSRTAIDGKYSAYLESIVNEMCPTHVSDSESTAEEDEDESCDSSGEDEKSSLKSSPKSQQSPKASSSGQTTHKKDRFPQTKRVIQRYRYLRKLLQHKDYFVVSTNTDEFLRRSGFPQDRIYTPHGSWRLLQCNAKDCRHVWPAEPVVYEMSRYMDWERSKILVQSETLKHVEGLTRHLRGKVVDIREQRKEELKNTKIPLEFCHLIG